MPRLWFPLFWQGPNVHLQPWHRHDVGCLMTHSLATVSDLSEMFGANDHQIPDYHNFGDDFRFLHWLAAWRLLPNPSVSAGFAEAPKGRTYSMNIFHHIPDSPSSGFPSGKDGKVTKNHLKQKPSVCSKNISSPSSQQPVAVEFCPVHHGNGVGHILFSLIDLVGPVSRWRFRTSPGDTIDL